MVAYRIENNISQKQDAVQAVPETNPPLPFFGRGSLFHD
jgi:hypothetical protein